VYGHFTEHLGGVIYDGVWVGESSRVPNQGGIRSSLIERLREIKAPIIRWPGGCFADSYDWQDGVGPRARRPKRVGFWRDEPNQFGTPEFVRFCRLSGAEPYLAANVRSLSPQAFDRWIEYCNAPPDRSTLGEMRAADGSPQPFNVQIWGVGNESWGCGGNLRPEEYSEAFRRFSAWLPGFGTPLKLIGSGPNSSDVEWTSRFFEHTFTGNRAISLKTLAGWSLHYYTWDLARGRTHDWEAAKGDALKFDVTDWYELFREGQKIESILESHWAAMAKFDSQHQVKLVVDEYGPWYRPGTAVHPSHTLGQQITLRDALHTAMTLNIFNRHPEKVSIATCAQLINCLNSLFLAHEDKFIITPVFQVFKMYAAHQGATAVRAQFSAPDVRYTRDGMPAQFWGLKGSASVQGKALTLTVVNPHVSESRETEIKIRNSSAVSLEATVLTNADIHAHNSFESPDVVRPTMTTVPVRGPLVFTFPAASVTRLQMNLG